MVKLKNNIYVLESAKVARVGEYYMICEFFKTIVGAWIYFILLYWQYDEDDYNEEEKSTAKTFLELNLIGLVNLVVFVM